MRGFTRITAFIFSLFLLLVALDGGGSLCFATTYYAYVSTVNDSKITVYTLNATTGALTPARVEPGSLANISSGGTGPDFIKIDPSGKFAYVANATSNSVSIFTISPSTGALTPGNPASVSVGNSPKSMAIDPAGKFVYVVNNGSNTISVFKINSSTGALTIASPATVNTGLSPFFMAINPAGTFAYVTNYNVAGGGRLTSNISVFKMNASTGALTSVTTIAAPYDAIDIVIDSKGQYAYVSCYNYNCVYIYKIDPSTGVLTPNKTRANPDAYILTGLANAADGVAPYVLAIDPLGRFLYTENYGSNTVSMLNISSPGELTAIAATPSCHTSNCAWTIAAASKPIFLVAEPQGKFLYAVNRDGNSLLVYSLDSNTGDLRLQSSVSETNLQPSAMAIIGK